MAFVDVASLVTLVETGFAWWTAEFQRQGRWARLRVSGAVEVVGNGLVSSDCLGLSVSLLHRTKSVVVWQLGEVGVPVWLLDIEVVVNGVVMWWRWPGRLNCWVVN